MNQSYWQKTAGKTIENHVDENIKTDVVIIGGGLSGVALAYKLKDSSLNVVVVEKDGMGNHTSGHTTAKVTVLHGLLYEELTKHYDIHQSYMYYQSNLKALEDIKDIIVEENIDCDFENNTSFIYGTTPVSIRNIENQKEIFQSLRVKYVEDHHYLSSMGLENQVIFHPLKYLYSLIHICKQSGVKFFEKSKVTKVEKHNEHYLVHVNNHVIECQYVVHATRYPFMKRHLYFFKLFQKREFIDYVKSNKNENSYLCMDETYSYRPVLKKDSLEISDHSKDWFAQDSIPLRGISYIGRLKKNENEFIIYGFQKWGMTLSHVAASIISDLILNKDNTYEELYGCHYFSFSFAKQYKSIMMEHITKGYITNRFHIRDINTLNKKEGALVKINGQITAVYKDNNEEFHYMSPYCPHLKCMIEFDEKSQTWNCPCHQSVYDAYGNLIEGPSLYSLKKKG